MGIAGAIKTESMSTLDAFFNFRVTGMKTILLDSEISFNFIEQVHFFVLTKVTGITENYVNFYDVMSIPCLVHHLEEGGKYNIYGLHIHHVSLIDELKNVAQASGFFASIFNTEEDVKKRAESIGKLKEVSVFCKKVDSIVDTIASLNKCNEITQQYQQELCLKRAKEVIDKKFLHTLDSITGEDIYYYLATPFNYLQLEYSDKYFVKQSHQIIKVWKFEEYKNSEKNNTEDILAFVKLVKEEIIPYFSEHTSHQNHWLMEAVLFELKNHHLVDIESIYQHLGFKIDNNAPVTYNKSLLKVDNLYSYDIGMVLLSKNQEYKTLLYLTCACHYHGYKDQAVYYAKMGYEKFLDIEQKNTFYQEFLTALKNRNADTFTCDGEVFINSVSDAQYAMNLMLNHTKAENINLKECNEIAEQIIAPIVKKGRGEPTNILGDIGRGLRSFGKGIGTALGGRQSDIPYSQAIIDSVPKMLDLGVVNDELNKSVGIEQELSELLLKSEQNNVDWAMGLSVSASMLWTYSQIDSSVLNALTFASAGNPSNFFELQSIALDTLDKVGAVTRLSGYVAEQQTALELTKMGQVVEFPDSPTQAGYDLLVNGEPFQVKNSLDVDYIQSHLDNYSDIPVLVNKELADSFAGNPMVIPVEGVSFYEVQRITHQSLEASSEFGTATDLLPVPVLSLAFALYRNFGAFNHGVIDGTEYWENVGVDTLASAGGATIGATLGGTIGTVVAFGLPIGTVIGAGLGGVIGGMAGSTGADAINREKLCDQRDVVVKKLIDFANWFYTTLLKDRGDFVKNKLEELQEFAKNSELSSTISSTFFAYQLENYNRLSNIYKWFDETLKGGNELHKVNAGWVALGLSSQFVSAKLNQKVVEINHELEKYKAIANPSSELSSGQHVVMASS